jgi:hypothetical protein
MADLRHWKKLLKEEKLRWQPQSDEKLFTTIESFADSILEKCRNISDRISKLHHETNSALVDLNIAYNTIENLSYAQFVANVLYK